MLPYIRYIVNKIGENMLKRREISDMIGMLNEMSHAFGGFEDATLTIKHEGMKVRFKSNHQGFKASIDDDKKHRPEQDEY